VGRDAGSFGFLTFVEVKVLKIFCGSVLNLVPG